MVATSRVVFAWVVDIGLNVTVVPSVVLGVLDVFRVCAFVVLEVAGKTDPALWSEKIDYGNFFCIIRLIYL